MINRNEIDILWQQAMNQAIADGEMSTRYHFASLVAAAECEACAKVCDSLASPSRLSDPSRSWITGTLDCAAAIRARSQQ